MAAVWDGDLWEEKKKSLGGGLFHNGIGLPPRSFENLDLVCHVCDIQGADFLLVSTVLCGPGRNTHRIVKETDTICIVPVFPCIQSSVQCIIIRIAG